MSRLTVLAWWFLAAGSLFLSSGGGELSPTVVGPFQTIGQCNAIRSAYIKASHRVVVSDCWDGGTH